MTKIKGNYLIDHDLIGLLYESCQPMSNLVEVLCIGQQNDVIVFWEDPGRKVARWRCGKKEGCVEDV